MGKPYSPDIRREVAAIEGGMSGNQAAKQLGLRSAQQPVRCRPKMLLGQALRRC